VVSIAQYKSFKPSKYRSVKCNGKHSKKEYKRGVHLKEQQRLGFVKNLREQVPFVLQEKFIDSAGNLERGIKYLADYVYFDNDKESRTFGKDIIEDVKSPITKKNPDYIIKRKMLKLRYPQYIFKEF
jgi:hypothetical protein